MKKTLQTVIAILSATLAITSANANNLFGIDVSSYQGSINWTTVHANGVQFAFAKATEGNYYQDADYKINMANGKSAGVQMGAYDFSRPDLDTPATEANYFWSFAGGKILADGKTISPAIIFDTFNGHVGTSTYTQWFNDWAADVKAKTTNSMAPVINSSCANLCGMEPGLTLGLWVSNYNGENLYTGNPGCSCSVATPWVYWQVTSTGAIGGISGNVDFDAYNGTLTKLKSQEGVGGI